MKKHILQLTFITILVIGCSPEETFEENTQVILEQEETFTKTAPTSLFSDVSNFTLETSVGSGTSGTSAEDFSSSIERTGIYQGITKRSGNYLFLQNDTGSNERTELKEINDRDLDDGRHALVYRTQPKNIPNGSGVTIGQIHHRSFGDSRPLIRVYVTSTTLYVVKAKTHVKETTTTESLGTLDFSSGDVLDITLEMKGDRSKNVRVYVKNRTKNKSFDRTEKIGDSDDSAWNDVSRFYFKAGVYNQGTNKKAHCNISLFDLQ